MRSMPRTLLVAAVALGLGLASAGSASAHDGDSDNGHSTVFEANLTPSSPTGPILFGGIKPGVKPWVVDEAEAKLDGRGQLRVELEGLVIPPPDGAGTNPLATVSASVVCGGVIVATTSAVPFSTAGDAEIRQTLAVPMPCVDPAVLVHPLANAGTYIAASM
jgi:hypothetical protein